MLGCNYTSTEFRLAHNRCGWEIRDLVLYFLERCSFGSTLFGLGLVDLLCLSSSFAFCAHSFTFLALFTQILCDWLWAWNSLNKFLELL